MYVLPKIDHISNILKKFFLTNQQSLFLRTFTPADCDSVSLSLSSSASLIIILIRVWYHGSNLLERTTKVMNENLIISRRFMWSIF